MWVWSRGQEDSLEERRATHCSILAWNIPWTEEPRGLQSLSSQRVRHNWSELAHKPCNRFLMLTWFQICLKEKKLKQLHTLIGTPKFCSAIHIICRIVILFVFILCIQNVQHQLFQFSYQSAVSDSLQPHEPEHTRPPCPSPSPGVHSNSCPLSQWCDPTISSSVVRFSSCPQSFPASGSFQMSHLFASGGQSIGVSASTSVLPMNTQDWSPLGWTGWISLQFKGLSRVFSNTTVQKH